MNIKTLSENIKGWCTWYCYYNKINPELILKNVNFIKEKQLGFNLIQIDDGYQKHVGDWLDLLPSFDGKMKYLANKIQENGFMPGIWIAPFIADRKSELAKIHPEYVLRNEYGIPIKAGYNPWWHGKYYYGLDITNPRFEEYIRKIIRVITHDWGFKYLKLDFMFSACLRGGNHHELKMSRAEVLKYGIKVIREEAGKEVVLVGCGMPLSTGIGTVDIMRVGPDTAAYWNRLSGFFLQTQAMIGARNSIRNSLVRSPMNKCLWINDPDCIMIRDKKTKLNPHQRLTLITTTVITGGLLIYSDDLIELSTRKFGEITKINLINEQCFRGRIFPLDLMEKEMPEFIYNSAGFIAVFNFKNFTLTKKIDLTAYPVFPKNIKKIKDAWTDEEFYGFNNNEIVIKNMQAYSSRLFKIFTE